LHRMNLIMEEVGEISQCLTKGKPREDLIEEHADLLILLLGNAISLDFDLEDAFWKKLEKIMRRKSRMVNGTIRVTET
ncbi:MAG: MazG nucleotide pyrophosphohydrolase domain-containing protein, partial [Candidatus Auribacterota bacterium]|nr:MazG nucleotide pyrophosphohydrolase domain-containing protein [Candidatus Auribacterota bacterium]